MIDSFQKRCFIYTKYRSTLFNTLPVTSFPIARISNERAQNAIVHYFVYRTFIKIRTVIGF